jgi:hypothetical protein
MEISDSLLKAFSRGDYGHDEQLATVPQPTRLKGIDRPWVVRTEREPTVEERLAALEARVTELEARLEAQG